ncbi:hypothetical protein LCGC14_1960750 [marine sediment metagenome]|uniref:Uncharacterized protein n=1 Tax=marine sediment metagenome TaxID=412755 RepID=A0A0F9IBT5_9ZZZZ
MFMFPLPIVIHLMTMDGKPDTYGMWIGLPYYPLLSEIPEGKNVQDDCNAYYPQAEEAKRTGLDVAGARTLVEEADSDAP